jgi:hypothetical protein
MPITKYPNGISSFGMPLLGGGPYVTTGKIFFVDSATGSDVNDGLSPDDPVKTLDYAIGLCTANKGDIIFIMPNHTENITAAGGITCDVEGVRIVGMGKGDNRPEIKWAGAAASAADIEIDADSVSFENVVFNTGNSTGTNVPLACIDVDDNHFSLINCEINNTGAKPALVLVDLDANADDFKMIGCTVYSDSDGGDQVITLGPAAAGLRGVEIAHNWFDGDWDAGCITTACSDLTEVLIHHNYMRNDAAGFFCVDVGTSAEENQGFCAWNVFDVADSDGGALEDASKSLFCCAENYMMWSGAEAQSGKLSPPTAYAS